MALGLIFEKEHRERRSSELRVLFVPYLEANPYQLMLMRALSREGVQVKPGFSLRTVPIFGSRSPDVVHLHWLPALDRSLKGRIKQWYFGGKIYLLRLFGIRVVWTVHNLRSHEGQERHSEQLLAKMVAKACSRIIVHSPSAKQMIASEFSLHDTQKVTSIPHGNFIEAYPNKLTRADARNRLGIPQTALVLLFLGLIRPYKGVNELIDEFKRIDEIGIKLIIAGKPINSDALVELQDRIGADSRIILFPGYVKDPDMQLYFNAADITVYPYKDVLTSGAVILGMSFAKACIAPRIGCIPDYLDEQGAFLYDDKETDGLRKALFSAVKFHDQLDRMGKHNFEKALTWDWESVSAQTRQQYR